MKMNRTESEEANIAESADRRQFLRNAMKVGGAAALLLTAASRKVLAGSLQLDPQELEAARRARQAPGAPMGAKPSPAPMAGRPVAGCDGCSGSCSGCSGSCTGACSGCSGSCSGGCTSCTGAN
jgi:hypothetical protein